MSEADPEVPQPTAPGPSEEPPGGAPPAAAPPPAGSPGASRSAAWLGIVAVVLGALAMVGGVVSIYLYAKRLPPKPSLTGALPPPLPPEVSSAPPPPTAAPSTSAKPLGSPPMPLTPFKEDAAALVPVERG